MATHRLTFVGGLDLASQAREWTCEQARAAGFDEEAIADIALAVSEAVSNIVRYAYEGRTDGRIEATLAVEDTALTLHLRDYGRKFNPDSYQTPDLDTPAEGGYGIFLMRTVMDEVRYETGHAEGTELVLVKKR
ncbi:MAG: ATP-binding protein [Chloroflexota bacterium]|nr:ATP-binding protein [Chloroflexota bacterium]